MKKTVLLACLIATLGLTACGKKQESIEATAPAPTAAPVVGLPGAPASAPVREDLAREAASLFSATAPSHTANSAKPTGVAAEAAALGTQKTATEAKADAQKQADAALKASMPPPPRVDGSVPAAPQTPIQYK